MIDIQKIISKAVENARKTEKLPPFSKMDSRILSTLRQRNYPTNRSMSDYFKALPLLNTLLSKDIDILDVGTGNGIALEEIKAEYECKVTGTGITEIDNRNIDFVIAEASSLPFKDNTFDLVISVHGISWAPNQAKAIKEAIRVLKPGCYCLIELIRFSSSVDIWYGDAFWNELEIDKIEYKMKYDFKEETVIPGAQVKITRIAVPEKQYKEKFYLEYLKV